MITEVDCTLACAIVKTHSRGWYAVFWASDLDRIVIYLRRFFLVLMTSQLHFFVVFIHHKVIKKTTYKQIAKNKSKHTANTQVLR